MIITEIWISSREWKRRYNTLIIGKFCMRSVPCSRLTLCVLNKHCACTMEWRTKVTPVCNRITVTQCDTLGTKNNGKFRVASFREYNFYKYTSIHIRTVWLILFISMFSLIILKNFSLTSKWNLNRRQSNTVKCVKPSVNIFVLSTPLEVPLNIYCFFTLQRQGSISGSAALNTLMPKTKWDHKENKQRTIQLWKDCSGWIWWTQTSFYYYWQTQSFYLHKLHSEKNALLVRTINKQTKNEGRKIYCSKDMFYSYLSHCKVCHGFKR